METLTIAGKITGAMTGGAIFAAAIDATTTIPVMWLFAGIGALCGGVWQLSRTLTNIEDRLKSLEAKPPCKVHADK